MAKILIVDDEPGVRAALQISVESFGHEVRVAASVTEAFPLLESIDLLVTDILMPERDGLELILAARKAVPHLKIIAMSGGGSVSPSEYLYIAHSMGANSTLIKPFSVKEFRTAITSVLSTTK